MCITIDTGSTIFGYDEHRLFNQYEWFSEAIFGLFFFLPQEIKVWMTANRRETWKICLETKEAGSKEREGQEK